MKKPRITVYTPESSLINPFKMISDMWADILSGRGLAWRLAVRDINGQYRQTFLGILWALIGPLASTVTWIFLNLSGIVSVGETELPYPVYVLTGTMLWAIFMEALSAPLLQTNNAKSMLAKINFPREALIMSGILKVLFNSIIKVGLTIVLLLIFGVYPDWHLILFPCALISLIMTGTMIGLLITPIGMLYTDVGNGLRMVMQFLMYVSPVVFPMPTEGWVATIFKFNPLTPLILVGRDWLTGMSTEYLWPFLTINLTFFLILLIAGIIYRIAMPIMIERLGS